jgi:NAD(P)H-dependent FMN reductase
MISPRIVAFAGSARRDSLNKRLIRVAAQAATDAGATVTLIDLDDYPMPVYHGDLETREGIPANARALKSLLIGHHGLLVASPENNASVSSLVKNTLDWVSRPDGGEDGLAPYRGKVAALLAASPGGYGGLRGLVHLRAILQALDVLVVSEQFALARAHEAFAPDGSLRDPRAVALVTGVVRRLIEVTARLA